MNLLNLAAKLTLDKSEYEKGLDEAEKDANDKGSKLSGALSGAGKIAGGVGKVIGGIGKAAAIGFGAATTATVGFVKQSVNEYAEYQQLWGGIQKLYGAAGASFEDFVASAGYTMAELNQGDAEHLAILQDLQHEYDNLKSAESIVAENAKNAFQTAGMSANDYMSNISGISASLINGLGGDTKAAAEMADMAMQDIADNVNTFGKFTIQDITAVYQSLARGNFMTLDNLSLGVAGTKAGMEELIKKAEGLDSAFQANRDESGKLTMEYSDMIQAIHIVQQSMNITGTTSREAAGTISGSLTMLKGAWSNLVAGISNPDADIGKLIDDVITSAKAALSNLVPTIKQAATGLVQLVRDVVPIITKELPDLVKELLPMIIETAEELLNGLIEALPDLIESLIDMLPSVLQSIIEAFLNLLPMVVQLGGDMIMALANGLLEFLPEALPKFIEVITGIVNMLKDPEGMVKFVDTAVTIIKTLAEGLIAAIPDLLPAVVQIILGLVDALVDGENLAQMVQVALDLMIALADGLIEAIPDIVLKIPEIIINIVEALLRAIPQIIEAGFEIMVKLQVGLIKAIPKILLAIPQIIAQLILSLIRIGGQLVETGAKLIGFLKDGIMNMGKNAKKWGKDLMDNFIGGIKAKIQKLKDAVSNVASTVKNFLGFSEPDEGPLSNFHTYAPDMIDLFIKGIKDNQKKLDDAITNAFDFKPMITGGMNIDGLADPRSKYVERTADTGGTTINVYAAKNQNVNELADIIGRKLNKDIRRNQEVWA